MARTRVPFLLAACLGLAVVVGAVAALALAADQPTPPQPQMVRFVCHFVAFMPKDPAILGGGYGPTSDPHKCWPRWDPVNSGRSIKGGKMPDGFWREIPFEEMSPGLGPLPALKGRDPKAVAELMTRLDDRWVYHVLTVSASGPIGTIPGAAGVLGPIPLKEASGVKLGRFDNFQFVVGRFVRVERVLPEGYALAQEAELLYYEPDWVWCNGAGPPINEFKLGATYYAGEISAGFFAYTSALGEKYPRVVQPGLVSFVTIELGKWPKYQAPTYF